MARTHPHRPQHVGVVQGAGRRAPTTADASSTVGNVLAAHAGDFRLMSRATVTP
ncbi:MAG: hypothetical protein U0Q19_17940 [Kineosporiaceae bacterium]